MNALDIESAVRVSAALRALLDEFDDNIVAAESGESDPQEWWQVWGDLLDSLSTATGLAKTAELEAHHAAAQFRLAFCRNVLNRAVGGAA
jgi:hypothetical protein